MHPPVHYLQVIEDAYVEVKFSDSLIKFVYDRADKFVAMLPNGLRNSCAFAVNPWTLYHIAALTMSISGLAVSPLCFAFHLVDIVFRIKLLRYVLAAVTNNYTQIFGTAFMGVLIIYLYTVMGLVFFGGEYSFEGANGSCNTLLNCFAQSLDYGLRSAPVWNDGVNASFSHHIFNISYHVFVILILVAIITGTFFVPPFPMSHICLVLRRLLVTTPHAPVTNHYHHFLVAL